MILENRKPENILKELEILEVSLVDRGSNPGSKVMIWKRDESDINKLENVSVKELTKAMESVDYKKLGAGPEELWEGYIAEVMANHNTELAQRQKHPPDRLSMQEVKELRQKKPWTLLQATTAARKTNIGQSLWQLVQSCVREREAALLEKLDKMDEELEAMKAMSQNTIEIYDKLKIERMKMGTIVEKILSKAFGSQVEAMNSLKLDLVKLAKAGDERTPERRLVDYLDNHPDVETAIRELPSSPEVEETQKRDFGPTYAKISKMVDELVSKGEVLSRAKGFVKVMDNNPELLVSYYKEQL